MSEAKQHQNSPLIANDSRLLLQYKLEEYKQLNGLRTEHIKAYAQTNFYVGLVTVAAAVASAAGIDMLYVVVPFLQLIQYAVVQWNQYHGFLAEVYLERIESEITQLMWRIEHCDANLNFFTTYNALFPASFLRSQKGLVFLKPTALLSTVLVIANTTLMMFCLFKGWEYLGKISPSIGTPSFYQWAFVVSILLILFVTLYNFVVMPRQLKPLLKEKMLETSLHSKKARDANAESTC